jgi:hypothetical protein
MQNKIFNNYYIKPKTQIVNSFIFNLIQRNSTSLLNIRDKDEYQKLYEYATSDLIMKSVLESGN